MQLGSWTPEDSPALELDCVSTHTSCPMPHAAPSLPTAPPASKLGTGRLCLDAVPLPFLPCNYYKLNLCHPSHEDAQPHLHLGWGRWLSWHTFALEPLYSLIARSPAVRFLDRRIENVLLVLSPASSTPPDVQ